MYHRPGSGGISAKKELFPSFLGGLDTKYLQEVYLDTTSTFSSPSISPTSTDTPITPLSPVAPTALSPNAFQGTSTQSPNFEEEHQHSFSNCANKCLGTSASTLLANNAYFQQPPYNNHLLLQQQQQQQLTAALVAQQQQQKNEISKSLKMFAMLAAYKSGNESPQPQSHSQSPVDAIMQDFARNGYVSDDLGLYQQHQQQPQLQHAAPYHPHHGSVRNVNVNVGSNSALNQPPTFNSNFTEMRKNFWMFHLPTQSYVPNRSQLPQSSHAAMAAAVAAAATAATAAAAANMDYNNSSSNSGGSCNSSVSSVSSSGSGYSRKPQKRSNSNKSDKFSTVKHCVFCENNNEPEAVVKSHAVRDSFGRVLCPKLRTYICPICKASGDFAHTVKYCPQKPIITMEDALKAEAFRLAKSTYYKQQMKV